MPQLFVKNKVRFLTVLLCLMHLENVTFLNLKTFFNFSLTSKLQSKSKISLRTPELYVV